MTLVDNQDGTVTDTDTGDQFSSIDFSPLAAVPDNTLFDNGGNDAEMNEGGVVDATGGNDVVNSSPTLANPATGGSNPSGFFDVVGNLISSIENGYNALNTAGYVQTPAQKAAALAKAQADANNQQVIASNQAANTQTTNTKYYVIGGVALVLLIILLKKRG